MLTWLRAAVSIIDLSEQSKAPRMHVGTLCCSEMRGEEGEIATNGRGEEGCHGVGDKQIWVAKVEVRVATRRDDTRGG